MVITVEMLTREQKRLLIQYRILCDEVKQYSLHVKSTESQVYKQALRRTQRETDHSNLMDMTINKANTSNTNIPPCKRQRIHKTGAKTTKRTSHGEQCTSFIGKAGGEVLAMTQSRKVNWVEILKDNRPCTRIPQAITNKTQHLKNVVHREQARLI